MFETAINLAILSHALLSDEPRVQLAVTMHHRCYDLCPPGYLFIQVSYKEQHIIILYVASGRQMRNQRRIRLLSVRYLHYLYSYVDSKLLVHRQISPKWN